MGARMTAREAAGVSREELSLQEAFIEGQRAGARGASASENPNQEGFPEYKEWERGRLSAQGRAAE